MIRETEPPRPSTRLSKLAGTSEIRNPKSESGAEVHGDLDWIVMKALEKDRSRRYETANALAEDIEHHLSHARSRKSAADGISDAEIRAALPSGGGSDGFGHPALIAGLLLATAGFIRASHERNRALNAERLAETHRRQSEATLRRLEIRRAQELFAQDQAASGVALLALLLRQDPIGPRLGRMADERADSAHVPLAGDTAVAA